MPVLSVSRSQLGWWLELTDTVSNSVFILHLLLEFHYFDIDTVMKTKYGKCKIEMLLSVKPSPMSKFVSKDNLQTKITILV